MVGAEEIEPREANAMLRFLKVYGGVRIGVF